MKKLVSVLLVVCMLGCMVAGCGNKSDKATGGSAAASTDEGHSVGFVTFGLGGDFFQALADTFVEKFEAAGWDAQYADGNFDPTTQIEACENFIAMDVDVLVLWSVAPEAMDTVVQEAMDKGIKVISFVAETSEYDALMVSDDADLADNCAKLAKFVTEVECTDESMDAGQTAMENLYTDHPEIKVFLTAHSAIGVGINNFFTSASSPVTDFSDMGVFLINGDATTAEIIKTSVDDKAPLRGMVLTGSVDDTAQEMLDVCTGVMDESLEKGYVQKAGTMFVYADTVEEYLESGTVTSVTADDFE